MNDWLIEDLDISKVLSPIENNFSEKQTNLKAGAYAVAYSDTYGAYGIYQELYDNYYNYSNSLCNDKQYVKDNIGEFHYSSGLDEIIWAQEYNDLINYINNAANFINNKIDAQNLSQNLKVNVHLNNVTISDIYYVNIFNNVNTSIQEFIDGVTNIINKISNQDIISRTDMLTFQTVLNNIKIPTQIHK